jgi:hypothetical protein
MFSNININHGGMENTEKSLRIYSVDLSELHASVVKTLNLYATIFRFCI